MKIPAFLLLAFIPLLAAPIARAVPPPRVGLFVWHESPNDRRSLEGVRHGFGLAGFDAAFLEFDAKGDAAAAREVLERWDAGDVDLVYAFGTAAALLARDHVRSRPVVFTAVTNPVGSGLVPDWEGSGTNLCGNSNWIAVADVLDVFRSTVPDLARLGVVFNRDNPVSASRRSPRPAGSSPPTRRRCSTLRGVAPLPGRPRRRGDPGPRPRRPGPVGPDRHRRLQPPGRGDEGDPPAPDPGGDLPGHRGPQRGALRPAWRWTTVLWASPPSSSR